MSEKNNNQEPKEQTTQIEDVTVDDTQQDEVKGGLLLPAVQKVRDAAGR